MGLDVEKLLETVRDVVVEAARFLRRERDRRLEEFSRVVRLKEGSDTRVVDEEAEKLIIRLLRERGIEGVYVSEEMGVVEMGKGFNVIIDPLDGSYNYICMIPFSAVSVAIATGPRFSDIVAAAVASIFTDDVFYAGKGLGAFFNGRRIPVKVPQKPVIVSLYGDVATADFIKEFMSRTGITRSRVFGCASLEISFAAAGTIDAFIDIRAKMMPHDVAAAAFIAREAGAAVVDAFGNELDFELAQRSGVPIIVSHDRELVKKIVEVARKFVGGCRGC